MGQSRFLHLSSGVAMIITDLHGVGAVYDFLRDYFIREHKAGRVDYLVICGDLIHGYGAANDDASMRMLLDVMRLQAQFGADRVIMLLGNHELPHIYSVPLSKGNIEFTPRFERAMNELTPELDGITRDDVLNFLASLPFYVTTDAGVLLTHAGASNAIDSAETAEHFKTFDHTALLRLGDDIIRNHYPLDVIKGNESYRSQVRYYLSVADADDPHYLSLIRGQILSQENDEFNQLWDLLFAPNENGSSLSAYNQTVFDFLQHISAVSPVEQRVLIAGHIGTDGGHEYVGKQHLRLSTYAHAHPPERGEYVLLDCAKPIETAFDLESSIHPVYGS